MTNSTLRRPRKFISCRYGFCNAAGINPSYEEKYFSDEEKRGRLRLIASPDGANGSVKIHAMPRCLPYCWTATNRLSARSRKTDTFTSMWPAAMWR